MAVRTPIDMEQVYNIYCDESCYLESDVDSPMVLGAVWCPDQQTREIAAALRDLKRRHSLSPHFELKYVKVSPSKIAYFRDVLNYFFDHGDLHFRAVIVSDKRKLRHELIPGQTADVFYYKMYFNLLSKLLGKPDSSYRIYLDMKDTHGAAKEKKLQDVLCNNQYDFDRTILTRLQSVRSHEVEQIQLADLLTGLVGRANRQPALRTAKDELVEHMRKRSGFQLTKTTLLGEEKVNIFHWRPSELAP